MTGGHITELLDRSTARELSAEDREAIESHSTGCARCLRAYEAFVAGGRLLSARASQEVEPSPFFTTRVMAAVRESQRQPTGSVPLWKPIRGLIASLVTMVVVLFVLSLY